MSVAAPAPGVKPGDRHPSAPVYTEALGPSRTHRHRTLKWTPAGCGCGVAELILGSVSSVYRVREFATRWAGRAFRFEKADGSDTRDVFLSADGR